MRRDSGRSFSWSGPTRLDLRGLRSQRPSCPPFWDIWDPNRLRASEPASCAWPMNSIGSPCPNSGLERLPCPVRALHFRQGNSASVFDHLNVGNGQSDCLSLGGPLIDRPMVGTHAPRSTVGGGRRDVDHYLVRHALPSASRTSAAITPTRLTVSRSFSSETPSARVQYLTS